MSYDIDRNSGEDGRPSSSKAVLDAKVLKTWADRYGVPLEDAKKLQRLMTRRHDQGVKECNGDPHYLVTDREDKSANAEAWGKAVEATISLIDGVCKRNNLVFDPGTGLWGSLMRDGQYIDTLPSKD